MSEWEHAGADNGWVMPQASWWKRLPLVRHVRALVAARMVSRWYSSGPGVIGIATGYDQWVLFGIFHGKERAI